MKFAAVITSLLFAAINADNLLRGPTGNQFTCEKSSAGGQTQCDTAKDDDGTSCVWCSVSSWGACVSQTQAEVMEKTVPSLVCDGDAGDDDNDDNEEKDDDSNSNDDNTDYWKCLETSKEKTCEESSKCAWCDTKGGYGICMEKTAAEAASKSDWFNCKLDLETESSLSTKEEFMTDPYDTSCLLATLQGDESSCESTLDGDGQACEWCSVSSVQVCLTAEQAAIAEQIGGDCSSDSVQEEVVTDPYDTSCLLATLQGDESSCESTLDGDGQGCEWCSVSSVQVCLTAEQAAIAEQIGGDCSSDSVQEEVVTDPYDTSCLAATLSGDESTCESTTDSEGQACEWCSVSSVQVCLTAEQAAIAEQIGGDCSNSVLLSVE